MPKPCKSCKGGIGLDSHFIGQDLTRKHRPANVITIGDTRARE